MPYLAMDTATQTLTVAIGERERLLAEASVVVKKNHSNRLMPLIESLLESLDLTPDRLKGIIVGHGPGSYTGIRIGVTTGKLMAWSLNLPLVGVSSLDGLAMHFKNGSWLVCPMFDARRRQVYCSLYQKETADSGTGKGSFLKIQPDALRQLDDLFVLIEQCLERNVRSGNQQKVMFVGDGAENYRQLILERFGEKAAFPENGSQRLVRSALLLDQGIARIEAGETAEVRGFAPEYLQLVEAEAKLLGLHNPVLR
jgi:tRNA threonylcarbamoyladenosine biosynthesis protein TsaB